MYYSDLNLIEQEVSEQLERLDLVWSLDHRLWVKAEEIGKDFFLGYLTGDSCGTNLSLHEKEGFGKSNQPRPGLFVCIISIWRIWTIQIEIIFGCNYKLPSKGILAGVLPHTTTLLYGRHEIWPYDLQSTINISDYPSDLPGWHLSLCRWRRLIVIKCSDWWREKVYVRL